MQVMRIRPSHRDSVERLCHDSGTPRFLLDLRQDRHEALRRRLLATRLERFIGVIYRPDTELQSHYAEGSLPPPFAASAWFAQTRPVRPLAPPPPRPRLPPPQPT